MIKAGQNAQAAADKAKRLQEMGAPDVAEPVPGETYVELNESQWKIWGNAEDVVHVIVTAESQQIIMDKPLREILNVNFLLWTSWCHDPDATDVYPDGAGDIVRVPNQILNAYFSQLVENGLLRGYGMNFYDATAKEGWSPVGYTPSPFGFYPLPGEPAKVLQHVEVPELASHLTEMEMITRMVETATAATAIEKGETPEGADTTHSRILFSAASHEVWSSARRIVSPPSEPST